MPPAITPELYTEPSPREESASITEGLWQEHFVDISRASMSANVGAAVAASFSYVTIPNFSSLDERLALQNSALALQQEEEFSCDKDEDSTYNTATASNHVMGASQVNFNCSRYSVERLLDGPAKAVSATLLDRLLRFIQDDADLSRIFASHKFKSPLPELKATWYAEPDENGVLHPEPKVNIYQQGGYFKQHTDGMQLTLLVVLNDAFEGGGTAFYSDREDDNGEEKITLATDAFDKHASPLAGTAILWGADLLHMALPVTEGMRAVFVGSFDLNDTE